MTTSRDSVSVALESTLTRFGEMVKQVARRNRLDEAEVDEVLQEVRIRLWRARGEGETIAAAPASYVYRTAMTATLDVIRRRRTHRIVPEDPAIIEALPGAATGAPADERLAERELEEQLHRAIETLPIARRAPVRMYLLGYTKEEIGDLMGWTEAKTRNLVYRGLSDLRSALAAEGIEVG